MAIGNANVPTEAELLNELFLQAADAGSRLYRHGQAYAPGASISFRQSRRIYITRSDCDFHSISEEDFSCVDLSGKPLNNVPHCSELPMHILLYRQRGDTTAVIHTHGTYAVLWSLLEHNDPTNVIPAYTPHLRRALGKVSLVPFAEPDCEAFLEVFCQSLNGAKAYLLKNHGAIVCGNSITEARSGIELVEEAARLAWLMRRQ